MSKSKSELREYIRWRINEHGGGLIPTTSAVQFDFDEALMKSYREWARRTRCFPVELSRAAVADQAIYHYGAFDVQAADTDMLAALALANNTTDLTLIDNPDRLSLVTVSLKNTAAGAVTGTAVTYTILGYGRGYMPVTDTIAFVVADDLTTIAAGATVTKTGSKQFLKVTSITPSAAQSAATWSHSAGVPAATPGMRVFAIEGVWYDEKELGRRNRSDMPKEHSKWLYAESGTPDVWIPEGSQAVRLWKPPSGTDPILIPGWETPDPLTFASDTAVTDLIDDDAEAMALWVGIMATVRNVSDENQVRQSVFGPEYLAAVNGAYRRYHTSGGETVQFGKHAPSASSGQAGWRVSETIAPP